MYEVLLLYLDIGGIFHNLEANFNVFICNDFVDNAIMPKWTTRNSRSDVEKSIKFDWNRMSCERRTWKIQLNVWFAPTKCANVLSVVELTVDCKCRYIVNCRRPLTSISPYAIDCGQKWCERMRYNSRQSTRTERIQFRSARRSNIEWNAIRRLLP